MPQDVLDKVENVQNELRVLNKGRTIRWTHRETWHITLAFLGEIEDNQLEVLKRGLGKCLQGQKMLPVELGQVVAFPNFHLPQILALGINDASGESQALQLNVKRRLLEIRVTIDEKKWHPHITLARLKSEGTKLLKVKDFNVSSRPFELKQVVIYESKLGAKGPEYFAKAIFDLEA